jgi:hypothetical protein
MSHRKPTRRELLRIVGAGAASTALPFVLGCRPQTVDIATPSRGKLRPVLSGDWWLIGPSPGLSGPLAEAALTESRTTDTGRLLAQAIEKGIDPSYLDKLRAAGARNAHNRNEPVDHHIFRGPDGAWHLWGCVRRTHVGRVLYHWEADDLEQSPWTATGEIMRCDPAAGECIDDFGGEEWIQSPFFVHTDGTYYMFYGGHSTGRDAAGNPVDGSAGDFGMFDAVCQMCLMTSPDGRSWTRHRNRQGFSRVFEGPGEVRDPCLIKIGDLWHLYYSGYEENPLRAGAIYVRTSPDLLTWSDYRVVHRDASFGGPTWTQECPHVVYRDGFYYLFVTENYYDAVTHVYRSKDPLDFGIEVRDERYVGTIACAAPEICVVDGREYVSSNHDPVLGTQMCQLEWHAD